MSGRMWMVAAVAVAIGALAAGAASAQYGTTEYDSARGAWSESVPKAILTAEFERFVAPDGKETNLGAIKMPWDLASTLQNKHPLPQGGIIWLRGGTYKGNFESSLNAPKAAPIFVRQYPGERAIIDGGLSIGGEGVWYWGFELTNSDPDRTKGGFGLNVYKAPNTKLINLVVHDTTNNGIGCWVDALDAEINGCIVYYNGYQGGGGDRGHCHAIYTQNREGTKHLIDNILFDQFSYGIHAYTEKGFVEGYDVQGNISFNNGVIARNSANTGNMLFVAGDNTMRRISVKDNYTYHTPSANRGSNMLDWKGGGPHEDITVTGNYFIGGEPAVQVWNWNTATFTGNTIYSDKGLALIFGANPDQKVSDYVWNSNTYYGSGIFRIGEKNVTWDNFRKQTGLDANSKLTRGRPDGVWTFVRPNKFEPGRANICIYNWDLKDAVEVDLSKALEKGNVFEIRDAQNFFGEPVARGVYNGGAISIPMKGLTVAPAKGVVGTPSVHTAPEFGVFVVTVDHRVAGATLP